MSIDTYLDPPADTKPSDKIEIKMDNEPLRKLIRDQIDEALSIYQFKFALWMECYLEFHGISVKQYTQGDEFYEVTTVDDNNQTRTRKIYDRALKQKNIYTGVSSSMAQIAHNGILDLIADIDNYGMHEVAQTFAKLLKKEWVRSGTPKEIVAGFWNRLLFGEMIFRTFYEEEKRDRHEKVTDDEGNETTKTIEDKLIYRGVRAKSISPFEFIPSPDWKTDVQENSWNGIRKFITPEQARVLYPEKFKNEKYDKIEGFYSNCVSDYKILDPYVSIRRVYEAKLDPETRELMVQMLGDLGSSFSPQSNNVLEHIEYFCKELDCWVVMIGDEMVEVEYMENDFYPLVVDKEVLDMFSARGVSDVEQALPLAQVADGVFDMRMKNLILQLSSVMLYNTKYFPETPSFGPGTAFGIALKPGDNMQQSVMEQVGKYSQNFEITQEQTGLERKVNGIMGINEFLAGGASGASSAKEVTYRQSSATANLDAKARGVEMNVFTEICNQWGVYIANDYESDFVFSLIDGSDTKYFLYLGDVEVDKSNDDYAIYTYKSFKFWEPNNDTEHMLTKIIADMQSEKPGSQQTSFEIPTQSNPLSDALGATTDSVDQLEIPKVKDLVGTWSDFVQRIITESGDKIQAVLTRGEIQGLMIKFTLKATQGVATNREIRKSDLLALAPYISQTGPEGVSAMIKMLVKAFDFSLDEIAPNLVNQQPAPPVQAAVTDLNNAPVDNGTATQVANQTIAPNQATDPTANALIPANIAAAGGNISPGSLPQNPISNANPTGSPV